MKRRLGSDLTRRDVVKGVLATSAVAQGQTTSQGNVIQVENRKPGSDWQLTNVRLAKPNGFRSRVIEGYCSQQSIEAVQTLQIMASCDPPGRFQIEIFRMGYYSEAGARLMTVLALG